MMSALQGCKTMQASTGEWPAAFIFVIALAVLVLGPHRVARAQRVPLSLDWDAPAECPDAGYVRRQVDALFAGESRPADSRRVHVDARVTVVRDVDRRYHVALRTVRNETVGERGMEGASCRSLADAVALVIALAMNPSRATEARASTATESTSELLRASPASEPTDTSARPAPPVAGATANQAEAVPRSASRVSPRWQGAVSAGTAADAGSMPGIAYGLALRAMALVGSAGLEGYATYFPGQVGRLAASPTEGGTFRLVLGGLRACYSPRRGDLDVAGCAGFELGSLHADGFGVLHPRPADSLWVAGALGLRASLEIVAPFRLALDLTMGVPLLRDRFALDQIGVVYQPSPFVGRAFLGPELRF